MAVCGWTLWGDFCFEGGHHLWDATPNNVHNGDDPGTKPTCGVGGADSDLHTSPAGVFRGASGRDISGNGIRHGSSQKHHGLPHQWNAANRSVSPGTHIDLHIDA